MTNEERIHILEEQVRLMRAALIGTQAMLDAFAAATGTNANADDALARIKRIPYEELWPIYAMALNHRELTAGK